MIKLELDLPNSTISPLESILTTIKSSKSSCTILAKVHLSHSMSIHQGKTCLDTYRDLYIYSPAGTGCYNFVYNCSTSFTDSCVITIPPCSISGGSTYYFTVSSPTSAVSYTVAANVTSMKFHWNFTDFLAIASTNSLPLNQQASYTNLQPNTYTTYTVQVSNVAAQSALLISTQIQQGSLSVFTSFGSIPLNAPCYQNLCEGTSGQTCEFYVPACCLQSGTYYTTVYNRYGNTLAGSFQVRSLHLRRSNIADFKCIVSRQQHYFSLFWYK